MPEGESARESGSPKPQAITHDNSGTNPACGLCIRSGGTFVSSASSDRVILWSRRCLASLTMLLPKQCLPLREKRASAPCRAGSAKLFYALCARLHPLQGPTDPVQARGESLLEVESR